MRLRSEWGAVHDYTTSRVVEEPATQLFLHITVTSPRTRPDPDVHARYVEAIGISRFGVGVSYNALVMPGGLLYEGQPIRRRGAHSVNDKKVAVCPTHGGSLRSQQSHPSSSGPTFWNLNYSARAIALARMVTDPVTDEDVDAIARWGASLVLSGEAIHRPRWHGHRDVSAKFCPGDSGYVRIPQIQALMEFYVDNPDQGDSKMEHDIAAMKLFGTAFWQRSQVLTGQPGGDVSYWGENRASHQEWVNAYPILWPAALRTMAAGGSGASHSHQGTVTVS